MCSGDVDRSCGPGLDLVPVIGEELFRAGYGLLTNPYVLVQAGEVPVETYDSRNGDDDLLTKDIVCNRAVIPRDANVSTVDRSSKAAEQGLREGESEARRNSGIVTK